MATQAGVVADVPSVVVAGASQGRLPAAVQFRLPNGTSAGECDLVWQSIHTLPDSGVPTPRDLTSLTDEFGAAVVFAELTTIYVLVTSTTGAVGVSPGASNPIPSGAGSVFGSSSSQVVVGAARTASEPGIALLHAPGGVAITGGAGTIDFVRVGSGTVDIIVKLIGRSA